MTRQGEDGRNGLEDGHKGHRSAEGPLASSDSDSEHGSPAQQAATTDALNGWNRQRVLEALAVTGSIEEAAIVANVSPWSVYAWQRSDPEFKERLALARRRAGERVVGKVFRAVMGAEDDQIVRTPTSAALLINGLLPEWRPNAGPVIDNRQLTVNVLSEQQAEAVARALAAVPPGEEMV